MSAGGVPRRYPQHQPAIAPPYGALPAGSYEHPPVWGGLPLPTSPESRPTGRSSRLLQPGVMPLRPLGLGDLYDTSIKAVQTNPRSMVGIPALVVSVLSLLLFVPDLIQLRTFTVNPAGQPADVSPAPDLPTEQLLFVWTPLLSLVLTSLAIAVVIGMLVVEVNGAAFGRTMDPGQLWSTIRRRIPGILGLALVNSLVPTALILVPGGLGITLFAVVHPLIAAVIGTILAMLGLSAAIVLFTWWSMAFPVMMLEGMGIRASLGRSRRMVKGHVLRVLGILTLTMVIIGVVDGMLSLPFSLPGMIILMIVNDPGTGLLLLAQASITVGDVVTGMILYPFIAAVVTLLYLDLRIRHEGLDVELMATQQEAG